MLQRPNDDEYFNNLIARRSHPMYAPLSTQRRKKMLSKKEVRDHWWHLMEFILAASFLVVLNTLISCIWSSHFYTNSHVSRMFEIAQYPNLGSIPFYDIHNISEVLGYDSTISDDEKIQGPYMCLAVYGCLRPLLKLQKLLIVTPFGSAEFDLTMEIIFETYLEVEFVQTLYNVRWYNKLPISNDEGNSKYWAADYTHKMIGLPVIRQLRVKPEPCNKMVIKKGDCIPKWSYSESDTDVYGVGWTPANWYDARQINSPWKYTFKSTVFTPVFYRLIGRLHRV